jgi:tetratricopeptide (TPR) repeat protein
MDRPSSEVCRRVIKWAIAIALTGIAGALAGTDGAMGRQGDVPKAYLDRGNVYLDGKEYDKAVVEYTRAIELNPDLAEAYNNRAMLPLSHTVRSLLPDPEPRPPALPEFRW